MYKPPISRLLVVSGAAMLALAGIVALFLRLRFPGVCAASAPFGWVIPLIAGFAIGGVAWVLLQSSPDGDGGGSLGAGSALCRSCGSEVLGDWRLCPHCGRLLGPTPDAAFDGPDPTRSGAGAR